MWIIFFILLISLVSIAIASYIGAPPVPTPQKAVEAMLEVARVKPQEKVYDLGSADGRIIITAAQKFKAQSVGYELSIIHFFYSKLRVWGNGLSKNVKVIYGNFYRADLSRADVITIFLRPETMPNVEKHVLHKLKPGTIIVSYAFPIKILKPQKILNLKKYAPIYLYKIT